MCNIHIKHYTSPGRSSGEAGGRAGWTSVSQETTEKCGTNKFSGVRMTSSSNRGSQLGLQASYGAFASCKASRSLRRILVTFVAPKWQPTQPSRYAYVGSYRYQTAPTATVGVGPRSASTYSYVNSTYSHTSTWVGRVVGVLPGYYVPYRPLLYRRRLSLVGTQEVLVL